MVCGRNLVKSTFYFTNFRHSEMLFRNDHLTLLEIAKFRNIWYAFGVSGKQRSYKISPIVVNGIKIVQVVIDSHYEEKHHDHMNDELILELVKELDGRHEVPEAKTNQYSYFATLVELEEKQFRLIWLLEDHSIYIGIVNAYRDRRRS